MLGLAESRRGNLSEAITHWSRAIELDPGDIKSAFALAQETARQGGADNEAAAMAQLQRLLDRSDNLAARLELARLAAKRGDAPAFRKAIAPLGSLSADGRPMRRRSSHRFRKAPQAIRVPPRPASYFSRTCSCPWCRTAMHSRP